MRTAWLVLLAACNTAPTPQPQAPAPAEPPPCLATPKPVRARWSAFALEAELGRTERWELLGGKLWPAGQDSVALYAPGEDQIAYVVPGTGVVTSSRGAVLIHGEPAHLVAAGGPTALP